MKTVEAHRFAKLVEFKWDILIGKGLFGSYYFINTRKMKLPE